MINGKKLAKVLRKSRQLIIEKRDDCYYVSDTYMLVKLNNNEFEDFFSKYNSYKSTSNIPFEIESTVSVTRGNDFSKSKSKLDTVIDTVKEADKHVEITEFTRDIGSEEVRIFKVNNEIGIFNKKYEFLLDQGEEYKSKGIKNPIFILKDHEVQAIIMPVRNRDKSIKDRFRELITGNKNKDKTAWSLTHLRRVGDQDFLI